MYKKQKQHMMESMDVTCNDSTMAFAQLCSKFAEGGNRESRDDKSTQARNPEMKADMLV
jgi:hypothetical protein